MLTFITNGHMWNGPQAPRGAPGAPAPKTGPNEYWVRQWGGGAQNSGGRMRPGRTRTLAVMARALNAAVRSHTRRRPAPAQHLPVPIA